MFIHFFRSTVFYQVSYLLITESHLLCFAEQIERQFFKVLVFTDLFLKVHYILYLVKEPTVDIS